MRTYNLLKIIIGLTMCCFSCFPANAKDIGDTSKKVVIEMPDFPQDVQPGTNPINFTDVLLKQLLPELKEPRLMSLKDLDDSTIPNLQVFITQWGYSFVVPSDFNRDGIADVAFVGKYKNKIDPDNSCFFAIVSIKNKKITRISLVTLDSKHVLLNFKKKYQPGVDAIELRYFSKEGYENLGFLFWFNNRWQYESWKE